MNSEIKINKVTTKEVLDELYDDSALTLEGLNVQSIEPFMNWVEETAGLKQKTVYVICGKVMNSMYSLTGDNAYPDNLSIVAVKLSDMVNPEAMIMGRFEVNGARWFSDVVDNNARREGRNK